MLRLTLSASALAMLATGAAVAGPVTAPEPPPPVVLPDPEPMGHWYGALSFGYAMPTTVEGTGELQFPPGEQDLELDLSGSYLFSGAVGYAMPTGLMLEGEVLYMHGESEELYSGLAATTFDYPGDYTVTAGMVNAWYSFGSGSVRPFVGGGIGMARVAVDIPDPVGAPPPNGTEDSDTSMAWQLGLGADISMSDTMGFVVSYRMLNIDDIELTDNVGDDLTVDYQNHIVTAGVRFSF